MLAEPDWLAAASREEPLSELAVMVPVPDGAKDPPLPTVSAFVLVPAVMLLNARLVVVASAVHCNAPLETLL